MSQTLVGIVNSVLTRLREDTVADYNDTSYSSLITKFVNDAKTQIEEMHDWSALRQDLSLSTTSSQNYVTLTGAGNRSRLIQVYDYSNNHKLQQVSYTRMKELLNYSSPATGTPAYYCIEGQDSSQDPKMLVYPIPDAAYNLKVTMIIPQADLAASATTLTINWLPVEMVAFAKALRERGEDSKDEMAEAIEITGRLILADLTKQGDENDWYVG